MVELICITCPRGCHLSVDENLNVTGNMCPRGAAYAKAELTHPVRMVTSSVAIISERESRLPVKTKDPIPKELIFKIMDEITRVTVKAPIKIGDVIIKNVLNTGVDIVATKDIER